jgi:hypothetical protein
VALGVGVVVRDGIVGIGVVVRDGVVVVVVWSGGFVLISLVGEEEEEEDGKGLLIRV